MSAGAIAARCELAVIGGGLVGAALAWGASREGVDVLLFDEGDVAHRASRSNFGLIWLQGKGVGNPPYMALSQRAGRLWPGFAQMLAEETGIDIGFNRRGGLHFCFSDDELAQRHEVARRTQEDGGELRFEILDHKALAELVPQIGPEVAGASYTTADAGVNPLLLLQALQSGVQAHGGRYRPGSRVTAFTPDGAGWRIDTAGGPVLASRVVLAAGLGSAALASGLGLTVPLVPERGQIIVTERLAPFFPYVSNYVQQTLQGTILVGSSHEDAGDEETQVEVAGALARTATRIFPALADVQLVRQWAGLRVMSPDRLPIYQSAKNHSGGFVVTCHSGVTLASVHALQFGAALAEGRLPDGLAGFSTDRFDV